MFSESTRAWVSVNLWWIAPLLAIGSYAIYRVCRVFLGRQLLRLAVRTESVYDDLVIDHLSPYRFAWLVPLVPVYLLSRALLGAGALSTDVVMFFIILVLVDLVLSLLGGFNAVYEHRPTYSGTSVAAYFDLAKVLFVVATVVWAIALFTDTPVIQLLAGVGGWLAVLLLIFRDTILNFLASIQISSQDLVRDGDWIDVPSYNASGTVTGVTLNTIKVRNSDNTITAIPTSKMVDVAFRNSRGISESGGRRVAGSLQVDPESVRFCDLAMLQRLMKYQAVKVQAQAQIALIREHYADDLEPDRFPLDCPQITNLELFSQYIAGYLESRRDLRKRGFGMGSYIGEPTPEGMQVSFYAYTRKTDFTDYVETRSQILAHLVAALPYFDLSLPKKRISAQGWPPENWSR